MLLSRSASMPPDSPANDYDPWLPPAQVFLIFDTDKEYQDMIKVETQQDSFGDMVVYWTDIMHLHENAIYLKDNKGMVTTFVKDDDTNETRVPLRALYSRDPLTIVVHKPPPDHVVVPLSKGLRIEPERTLSASTRIRKNLYRALFRASSVPILSSESSYTHHYQTMITTTATTSKSADSQPRDLIKGLIETIPLPPTKSSPPPFVSQMPLTAVHKAWETPRGYLSLPLLSSRMATCVVDPTVALAPYPPPEERVISAPDTRPNLDTSSSPSSDSTDSETKKRITTKTTVTTTKNAGRIYTTTGTGGRTVITERTETGSARHVLTGVVPGSTTVRTITQRTETGEEILIPVDHPEGEEREIITDRDENGKTRYIIGGLIAGAIGAGVVRHVVSSRTESESGESSRIIPAGTSTLTSSTRIVTERTLTGEIRYIIVGGFSGSAIRVITERTTTGEIRMIPTNDETAEIRQVISERSESGEIRYIVGTVITTTTTNTITRMIMRPRIITERTSTGEIRYVIVDQYNGNAIRTKFERSEETGEFVHIPVKEPEGELRYVTEERTETGEIRKVIGTVITGKVTTTTLTVSGSLIPEGTSTSTQTRIVAERTESGDVTYYQITNGPDGQEIRTVVERTEDGGFRIPGGAIIVRAGATLVGNNHQTRTTTRVVGGGVLTPAEQAANKTQITLKLSIMRYERADASTAIPSAAIGTVMFSKFKMIAAGDVNIDDIAYSHVEEVKTGAHRTIKWMKTEVHWKREAGMLQHLKSDRYIAHLFTLYSLPTFAEYRFVSILGSFSRTLESYMQTLQLTSIQIRQLAVSLSDALRWCHEHHVVHLNVRPASFYLEGVAGQEASEPLVWKLWNFGHARFVGETVDTAVTTVSYAAPEILNGRKKSDANVLSAVTMDRWSLGLILYELHARKAYFSSGASAEYQLTNEDGTQFEPALEAVREDDARRAIRGLLEVDVEKRYTYETLTQVYTGKA